MLVPLLVTRPAQVVDYRSCTVRVELLRLHGVLRITIPPPTYAPVGCTYYTTLTSVRGTVPVPGLDKLSWCHDF